MLLFPNTFHMGLSWHKRLLSKTPVSLGAGGTSPSFVLTGNWGGLSKQSMPWSKWESSTSSYSTASVYLTATPWTCQQIRHRKRHLDGYLQKSPVFIHIMQGNIPSCFSSTGWYLQIYLLQEGQLTHIKSAQNGSLLYKASISRAGVFQHSKLGMVHCVCVNQINIHCHCPVEQLYSLC